MIPLVNLHGRSPGHMTNTHACQQQLVHHVEVLLSNVKQHQLTVNSEQLLRRQGEELHVLRNQFSDHNEVSTFKPVPWRMHVCMQTCAISCLCRIIGSVH